MRECLKVCKKENWEFGEKSSDNCAAEQQQHIYQHGMISEGRVWLVLQRAIYRVRKRMKTCERPVSARLLPKAGKSISRLEVPWMLQHLLCEAFGSSLGRSCISQGPCAELFFSTCSCGKGETFRLEHLAGEIKCGIICFTIRSRLQKLFNERFL